MENDWATGVYNRSLDSITGLWKDLLLGKDNNRIILLGKG